jgi:hypothetical protein
VEPDRNVKIPQISDLSRKYCRRNFPGIKIFTSRYRAPFAFVANGKLQAARVQALGSPLRSLRTKAGRQIHDVNLRTLPPSMPTAALQASLVRSCADIDPAGHNDRRNGRR